MFNIKLAIFPRCCSVLYTKPTSYFYQILNAFRKLNIMSEIALDIIDMPTLTQNYKTIWNNTIWQNQAVFLICIRRHVKNKMASIRLLSLMVIFQKFAFFF